MGASSYMQLSRRTAWVRTYSPIHYKPFLTSESAIKATLEEALALCFAIKVPCATAAIPITPAIPVVSAVPAVPAILTVPAVPAVPTAPTAPPPLRRSERLLNKQQPTTTPLVLAPKKGSSRVGKSICRLCKGKQKAIPGPNQVRLGITSMTRFRDTKMVQHVGMGFRFLNEGEEVEGRTTLVLTLGEDITEKYLEGLDRMEVDVILGFAKP